MGLQRVVFSWCLMVVFSSGAAAAAEICQGNLCRAFLSRPVEVHLQQGPVWCWAASMQAIFDYYGHSIDQQEIVRQILGSVVHVTGNPLSMATGFNKDWTDDAGVEFTSTALITDNYWHTSHDVTNADVIQALRDDRPVFFGNTTHAMVLLAADYYAAAIPYVVSAIVMDPAVGIRLASGPEISALYVAIPSIE